MEERQQLKLKAWNLGTKYWMGVIALFFGCSLLGGGVYFLIDRLSSDSPKEVKDENYPTTEFNLPQGAIANEPGMSPPNLVQSKNQEFLDGYSKLQSSLDRLKDIDKIQDLQQGIGLIDKSLGELEEARSLMLKVPPESNVYQTARSYLTVIEQNHHTASQWKQFFISSSVSPSLSNAFVDASPNKVRQKFPELSIKQKEAFLTAMKPNTVAITFDDGPTREYTPQILNILQKNNVKATFFVVGKRVRENCDVLRQIYQGGHEIANHTDTHPYMTKIPRKQQIQEIQSTQQSVNQCLGFNYPMNWFRAPYGDQNQELLNVVRELGLNSAQWIVDTNDWKKTTSVSEISNSVNRYQNPGVVLMHDGALTNPNFIHPNEANNRTNTVAALEPMLNNLRSRGFNFSSLSEVF